MSAHELSNSDYSDLFTEIVPVGFFTLIKNSSLFAEIKSFWKERSKNGEKLDEFGERRLSLIKRLVKSTEETSAVEFFYTLSSINDDLQKECLDRESLMNESPLEPIDMRNNPWLCSSLEEKERNFIEIPHLVKSRSNLGGRSFGRLIFLVFNSLFISTNNYEDEKKRLSCFIRVLLMIQHKTVRAYKHGYWENHKIKHHSGNMLLFLIRIMKYITGGKQREAYDFINNMMNEMMCGTKDDELYMFSFLFDSSSNNERTRSIAQSISHYQGHVNFMEYCLLLRLFYIKKVTPQLIYEFEFVLKFIGRVMHTPNKKEKEHINSNIFADLTRHFFTNERNVQFMKEISWKNSIGFNNSLFIFDFINVLITSDDKLELTKKFLDCVLCGKELFINTKEYEIFPGYCYENGFVLDDSLLIADKECTRVSIPNNCTFSEKKYIFLFLMLIREDPELFQKFSSGCHEKVEKIYYHDPKYDEIHFMLLNQRLPIKGICSFGKMSEWFMRVRLIYYLFGYHSECRVDVIESFPFTRVLELLFSPTTTRISNDKKKEDDNILRKLFMDNFCCFLSSFDSQGKFNYVSSYVMYKFMNDKQTPPLSFVGFITNIQPVIHAWLEKSYYGFSYEIWIAMLKDRSESISVLSLLEETEKKKQKFAKKCKRPLPIEESDSIIFKKPENPKIRKTK